MIPEQLAIHQVEDDNNGDHPVPSSPPSRQGTSVRICVQYFNRAA